MDVLYGQKRMVNSLQHIKTETLFFDHKKAPALAEGQKPPFLNSFKGI
ncbi:hypothetical protein [Azotobacter beijerinckii]|nr:hypothetical protein [Azotobacter beijerinckii]MDV7211340.1 hypothetical protein [Azotobacter beijerinckii]